MIVNEARYIYPIGWSIKKPDPVTGQEVIIDISDTIEVRYSDIPEKSTGRYPTGVPEFDDPVDVWLLTNSILAYDPYYDWTDDELKDRGYDINKNLANAEVESAEATPQQGVVLNDHKRLRNNDRRDNRSKKNAGNTPQDDAMSDYVDEVYDVLDTADDAVELLNTAQLKAWDGSSTVWPTWTPPV